jgi:hypothetical protein
MMTPLLLPASTKVLFPARSRQHRISEGNRKHFDVPAGLQRSGEQAATIARHSRKLLPPCIIRNENRDSSEMALSGYICMGTN